MFDKLMQMLQDNPELAQAAMSGPMGMQGPQGLQMAKDSGILPEPIAKAIPEESTMTPVDMLLKMKKRQ